MSCLILYGILRNIVLKRKKEIGLLAILGLGTFLCYSYKNEVRVGKVSTSSIHYNGPNFLKSSSFLRSYKKDDLENLAIGEAIPNPLDPEKVVESLIGLEEESLIQARVAKNGSFVVNKPVFDADGNEIGLRFLALSDWGGKSTPPYTTSVQINLAKSMSSIAERYDCSFVISLGDNFREKGVKNVEDFRFEDTYEDVFTQASLQKPWYIVAGDVDYRGNVTALIDYSQRSKRWNFDKNYYKITTELATFKNVTVDFVFIDTVELCGTLSPSGLLQPLGPENVRKAEEQWSWINEALKSSAAEYLIVAGHYPVFSGGKHGSTNCLVDRLQPMLREYHASAYLGGHDHSMQHIKSSSPGSVHYFVSGAANDEDDRPDNLDGIFHSARYFWTNHLDKTTGAFTYCDVRKNEMTVNFIHSDESVLYSTTIFPRSHPSNKISKDNNGAKEVKGPSLKKHESKEKDSKLPVIEKFTPKSKEQLQKEQKKLLQSKQAQKKKTAKISSQIKQRLMQQPQLHASKMGQRYRGP